MPSRILMGAQYYDVLCKIGQLSVGGLFAFPADQGDGQKLMVVTAVDKEDVYFKKARDPMDKGDKVAADTNVAPILAFTNYQVVE